MSVIYRQWVVAVAMLVASAIITTARAEDAPAAAQPEMTLDVFLDRLMQAESGGRLNARNPASTAVGPYQFIASTWLQIANKSFAAETAALEPHQILELRTDLDFARRAAKIYTEQNAAYLVAQGVKATFPNLRLAFLVGAGGAAHVLAAKPETPVATLLGATVIGANPFMRNMTAEDLIARAARDIATDATLAAGLTPDPSAVAAANAEYGATILTAAAPGETVEAVPPKPRRKAKPKIEVDCNLSIASCRRWLALAQRRVAQGRRASNE